MSENMSEKGKYLYCVIRENVPKRFNLLGQTGKEVYTINHGGLAMVVSDSRAKEYFLTREQLLLHQKVIERIMQQGYDVLPVGFGVIAKDEETLKEKLLKSKRKEFLHALKTIGGKVELGLRALWRDLPGIFQEIVAENRGIQIAKQRAEKNPSRMQVAAVGELVQKALAEKKEREAEKILGPLKKLAVDFKERPLMGDAMLLNAVFLVSKLKEKEFDKKIECLAQQYRKIKFIYVGPLPPFNFVDLHLNIS